MNSKYQTVFSAGRVCVIIQLMSYVLVILTLGSVVYSPNIHASVYENLKQEKDNYRLNFYPSEYFIDKNTDVSTPIPSKHTRVGHVQSKVSSRPFYTQERQEFNSDSVNLEILSGAYRLKDLEGLVLIRNAGIASAGLMVQAARDGYSQVNEFNDILIQYSAFTEGLKTGVGPQKGRQMSNTQFPYPGNMQLKNRVVSMDVRMAQNNLEIQKREAITRLRTVYWDYVYTHRAGKIIQKVVDQLAQLRQVAQRKYTAGQSTYYDVVRLDIRLALLKKDQVTLTREEKKLIQDLLDLLNLPLDTPVAPPKTATINSNLPPFEPMVTLALKRRQELDQIQSRIDRMTYMVQAAENMIRPGYSLNLSDFEGRTFFQAGPGAVSGFKYRTMASKGYGTPLKPFSAYLNSWLGQIKTEIKSMDKKLEQEEFRVVSQVKKAWVGLDQAIREKELYETSILDLSSSLLEVALRGYESGKLDFSSVSESYTQWLNTNLAMALKETRIGIFDAKIDQVIGMSGGRVRLMQTKETRNYSGQKNETISKNKN